MKLDLCCCMTICSRIGTSSPDSLPGLVVQLLDDLTAAEHAPLEAGSASCIVAHFCTGQDEMSVLREMRARLTAKLLDDGIRDTLLEVHLAVDVARLSRLVVLCLRATRGYAEARGVERSLDAVPAEDVQQDLNVALGLCTDKDASNPRSVRSDDQ